MHRIFFGDGRLVLLDIRKSARDHRPSQRLVQQRPVLVILYILCIHVQLIVLLDGSAQSRGAGARLAGKREFPKGRQAGFQRSPPPDTPHRTIGRTPPGSAGVPPASCPLGCRSVSLRWLQPATLPVGTASARPKQSHGVFCPVDPARGDGRGCARFFMRAGRPRSRVGLHPITSSHLKVTISQMHRGLVGRLKQFHSYSYSFVSIRGSSSRTIGRFVLESIRPAPRGPNLSEFPVVVPVAHPGPDGVSGLLPDPLGIGRNPLLPHLELPDGPCLAFADQQGTPREDDVGREQARHPQAVDHLALRAYHRHLAPARTE